MNQQWMRSLVLVASLCSAMCCCRDAIASPTTVEPVSGGTVDEALHCPRNRLPVAPLYWQHASAQLQWQVTDQQIGWVAAQAAMQVAEFSEQATPANPVRLYSGRDQQRDLLVWQLPDGTLHAAGLAAGQLEPRWQVLLPANPTWLPAPLTMLAAPLAGQRPTEGTEQARGAPASLLISGKAGQAVQLVALQDGRIASLDTPDSAGAAIANPLAFDTDMDGDIDRIYFISAQQQLWRLDWQHAGQWQARQVARLHDSVGVADAALQGWQAYWPASQVASSPRQPESTVPYSAAAPINTGGQQPARWFGSGMQPATEQGDVLLMLTRHTTGYGVLVLKIADEPGPVLEIVASSADAVAEPVRNEAMAGVQFNRTAQQGGPLRQGEAWRHGAALLQNDASTPNDPAAQDDEATPLLAGDSYWFRRFRERPVRLPVVLGSVVYLPVSAHTECAFAPDYQQVLALNLFNGTPVYTQPQLRFRQPQTDGLRLQAESTGFSLGTAAETLLPEVKLLDPQCRFCIRPLTVEALSQRRWLAGYLAEEAF